MRGKTVLVTGSTAGVGRQTAIELAHLGATVLVHGRDPVRGECVLAEVQEAMAAAGQSPHDAALYLVDLSSMKGVRALGAQIRRRCSSLDVLVNNAAVYAPRRTVTTDGLELTFAVNVVAPFLLTTALLPLLAAAAPSRIVNLSSTSHWQGVMRWDDLQLERGYTALLAYEQSKLALSLFTFELARRLAGRRITVNCLDPGNVDTAMLRAGWPELEGVDLVTGAATSVLLASSPEVAGVTGVYYELGRETTPAEASTDRSAQARLWTILEGLTGEDEGERTASVTTGRSEA